MNKEVVLNFCKNPQNKIDFGAYLFNQICNKIKGCVPFCEQPCSEECEYSCDGVYTKLKINTIESSRFLLEKLLAIGYDNIPLGVESFVVNGVELITTPKLIYLTENNVDVVYYGTIPYIRNIVDVLNDIHPDIVFSYDKGRTMFVEFPSCYEWSIKTYGSKITNNLGHEENIDVQYYDQTGLLGQGPHYNPGIILGNAYNPGGVYLGYFEKQTIYKCGVISEEEVPLCQNGPIYFKLQQTNAPIGTVCYSVSFVQYDPNNITNLATYTSPTDAMLFEYSLDDGITFTEFDDDLSYGIQFFCFPTPTCNNSYTYKYNTPDVRLVWDKEITDTDYASTLLKIFPNTSDFGLNITNIEINWGDGSSIETHPIIGNSFFPHLYPDGEYVLTLKIYNDSIAPATIQFMVFVNPYFDNICWAHWLDFTNGITNMEPTMQLCSSNILLQRDLFSYNTPGSYSGDYMSDRINVYSVINTPNLSNPTIGDRIFTKTINEISNIDFTTEFPIKTDSLMEVSAISGGGAPSIIIRATITFADGCPNLTYQKKLL